MCPRSLATDPSVYNFFFKLMVVEQRAGHQHQSQFLPKEYCKQKTTHKCFGNQACRHWAALYNIGWTTERIVVNHKVLMTMSQRLLLWNDTCYKLREGYCKNPDCHPMSLLINLMILDDSAMHYRLRQGGRSWQLFVEGKIGRDNFRQVRVYYFHNKCVVFARNRKFANLTQ